MSCTLVGTVAGTPPLGSHLREARDVIVLLTTGDLTEEESHGNIIFLLIKKKKDGTVTHIMR